ncbi:MAG: protein phosphatase 2C domain-containing protein [Candidatus Sedimenticola sp. (ex Thyasira tokunagai)]
MSIEVVSRTDRGLVRKGNEDSLALFPQSGLVILADGMGGYSAGEVASGLATETVAAQLLADFHDGLNVTGEQVTAAVMAANRVVVDSAEQVPEWQGMGTTLLLGCFHGGRVTYAHIGDSRLYRYRAGRLESLTQDHTLIQRLIDDGVFASHEEGKAAGVNTNALLRGVGIGEVLEVEVAEDVVEEGDLFLFCSDGLSNMVPDALIETTMGASDGEIEVAADRLLSLALENGGLDNISLVLVRPKQ